MKQLLMACAFLASAIAVPVYAHHSMTGFDRAKTVNLVGTIKGFGCPSLSDNVFEWHRKSPRPEEFEMLMKELENA